MVQDGVFIDCCVDLGDNVWGAVGQIGSERCFCFVHACFQVTCSSVLISESESGCLGSRIKGLVREVFSELTFHRC